MSPPTRSNNPPRFSDELLDSQFEDLCRDVFGREPGIRACIRYGVRGQKQHGIDLLAEKEQGGNEVAQCKCYKEFGDKDLRQAADEFLNSADHWRDWGITRFVLMVGCSVQDAKTQNEKEIQRKRFAEVGIGFELWGDTSLADKLRPHADLVDIHIGAAWVRKLCGPSFATEMVSRAVQEALVRGPVGDVLTECADSERSEVGQKFTAIREMARAGRMRAAFEQIEEYRGSPRWVLLDTRSQGRGLRLAASLYLDFAEDVQYAEQLMIEARRLAPDESYQVVEGSIAYRRQGRAAALEIVGRPLDLDSWNMKLALLVEDGQFDQVLNEIRSESFSPNANSWRIASIAALLCNNFVAAEEYANRAVGEAPNWFLVRLHAAKMNYLSTLLPHFPMLGHLNWPIPPRRVYLRCDAGSLQTLNRAEVTFGELLELMDENDDERVLVEGWRLGCMANHPERRHEAAQYARKLLESNPTHLPAAVWAMERGFEIDANTVSVALAQRDEGLFGADDLQASCALLAQITTPAEALVLLEQKRPDFEKRNGLFFWRLLKAQFAEDAGNSELASQLIQAEPEEANRLQIQLAVLKIQCHKTGDVSSLCQQLLGAFERDESPKNLFALFEALVQAGRGAEATKWTDDLVRLFPTPSGLTLALQASFDAGQFKKCLDLLEKCRMCFADQRPPSRVVRLEIECLRQVGRISDANALAELLVKHEESTSSLIALFQTQITLADFKGSVLTVRDLLHRNDVSITGLLQMADAIQVEDVTLAKDCWKEAVRRGIEGAAETVAAVDLAFRLGLDEEASPLMPKVFALARDSGSVVQAVSPDHVKEMMREHVDRQTQTTKIFNDAQVPAHLIAGEFKTPLAALLTKAMHQALASGRLHEHFPALIRPGTKATIWDSVPLKVGKVFMDVTALYLAEEIGILSLIETRCAPVFISSHVLEFIQSEIHRVTPHQPALHQPRVGTLQLVERGALKILDPEPIQDVAHKYLEEMGKDWSSMLSAARRSGGVLCDFTPPRGQNNLPIVLEAQDAARLVSCGDLVGVLRKMGQLSAEQAAEASRKLGDAGWIFQVDVDLQPGTLVMLDIGIAEQLAGANVLALLTDLFEMKITRRALEHLRTEVAGHQSQVDLARRLKETADRLRRGIMEGTYKTLAGAARTNDQRAKDFSKETDDCLHDLFAATDAGLEVVWVDDRFLMRFDHVGTVRITGISDVLKTLRKQGVLTPHEYFEHLLGLRSRNARYLPLEDEEVWAHIQAAPVVQGEVYETKALETLRRYLAACFSDFGRLSPPIKTAKGVELAEFPWVIGALRAVADSIARLWTAESLRAQDKAAKADWLLQNLYAPYHGVIESVTREPANGGGIGGVANGILILITAGFVLPSPWNRTPADQSHPRAQFYAWIADRLIDPCLQTEPEIARVLAREAKRLFLGKRDHRGSKQRRQIVRGLALRVFLDLPKALQEEMKLDVESCKWLGLRLSGPSWGVTTCGRKFPAPAFWRALARALKGNCTTVRSSDTNQEFVIGPAEGRRDALRWVRLSGPDIPEGHHIRDVHLRLLCGSQNDHRRFLETRTDWLDCRVENRQKLIELIVEPRDAGKRMERLGDAQAASAAFHYQCLGARVRAKRAVTTPECLPPTADVLCEHLRLDAEELADTDALEKATRRLVSDVGLAEAIERLASFPVLLPAPVVSAVTELGEDEFRALMSRLRRKHRHPIARLHVFHLAAVRSLADIAWMQDAQALRDEVFAQEELSDSWKAFHRILCWTKNQMQSMHSYRHLPATSKLVLVWLHAGRLFDSLTLAGADSECLLRAFEIWSLAHGMRMESHEEEFYFDAMHPRFAGKLPCMIRSFGAILSTLPLSVSEKLKLERIPWAHKEDRSGSSANMLLRDNSILRNRYGSFLGGDARELMLCAAKAEAVDDLLPLSPTQMIAESIAELEESVDAMPAWRVLAWTLADAPISEETAARMNGLLERVVEKKLFVSDENGLLLVFASNRAHSGISDSLRQKLETAVWEWLDRRRKKCEQNENDKLEQVLDLALNCFAGLAIVEGNESATQRNFHRFLARVARAWPDAASKMTGASCWPAYLPVVSQTGYWEAAAAIRASRNSSR